MSLVLYHFSRCKGWYVHGWLALLPGAEGQRARRLETRVLLESLIQDAGEHAQRMDVNCEFTCLYFFILRILKLHVCLTNVEPGSQKTPRCLRTFSPSPSSQPREVGALLSSSCGQGHGHREVKGQEGAEKGQDVSSRIFLIPLLG